MYKVFIDGQSGTTGLQIQDRLQTRNDIELLNIDVSDRKNPDAKKLIIAQADVVILCLPDAAAIETAALAAQSKTRLLDASSAHRTHPDWVYGLPELCPEQRDDIKNALYVSNPGCYPTGFLLAIAPLTQADILKTDSQLSISAVSGYSGGGHNMIDRYQASNHLWPSRPYGLKFGHKHLPEMQFFSDLKHAPLFMPSVGHYEQGMLVSTPLPKHYFNGAMNLEALHHLLADFYADEPCVTIHGPNDETDLDQGFLNPEANNGSNRIDIYVFGNEDQFLLVSQLDNLGKGAAGAAVQNLNLMLGQDELLSLTLTR